MTTTAGRGTKLYGTLIGGNALALSRDARLLGVEAEAWSDALADVSKRGHRGVP